MHAIRYLSCWFPNVVRHAFVSFDRRTRSRRKRTKQDECGGEVNERLLLLVAADTACTFRVCCWSQSVTTAAVAGLCWVRARTSTASVRDDHRLICAVHSFFLPTLYPGQSCIRCWTVMVWHGPGSDKSVVGDSTRWTLDFSVRSVVEATMSVFYGYLINWWCLSVQCRL